MIFVREHRDAQADARGRFVCATAESHPAPFTARRALSERSTRATSDSALMVAANAWQRLPLSIAGNRGEAVRRRVMELQ